MDEHDLTLVTTEQLITELLARFDHGIICGMFITDSENMKIVRKFKGNNFTAAGLARYAELNIMRDVDDRSNDLTSDDL